MYNNTETLENQFLDALGNPIALDDKIVTYHNGNQQNTELRVGEVVGFTDKWVKVLYSPLVGSTSYPGYSAPTFKRPWNIIVTPQLYNS